jgi:hypothetical protein
LFYQHRRYVLRWGGKERTEGEEEEEEEEEEGEGQKR